MYARWSHAQGAIALAALLVVAGCTPAAAAPKALDASLSEYKVDVSSSKASAGTVTFSIKNGGTVTHEFVVMRTDLASDKLPAAADGTVDEESADLTGVDEVEDIAPGASATLSVDLPVGHYVLICNLPGHYTGGMHASLEVTGAS